MPCRDPHAYKCILEEFSVPGLTPSPQGTFQISMRFYEAHWGKIRQFDYLLLHGVALVPCLDPPINSAYSPGRTMGDASLAIVSSTVSPLLPRIMRAASAADALLFGLVFTSYGRNFTGSSLRGTGAGCETAP